MNLARISLVAIALLLATTADAAIRKPNKPCSGKKGGIAYCAGASFVCRDGTTSQSKRDCRTFGGVRDQRPEKG